MKMQSILLSSMFLLSFHFMIPIKDDEITTAVSSLVLRLKASSNIAADPKPVKQSTDSAAQKFIPWGTGEDDDAFFLGNDDRSGYSETCSCCVQ